MNTKKIKVKSKLWFMYFTVFWCLFVVSLDF